MNSNVTKLVISLGFFCFLFSCKKNQCQETIPTLTFKSFDVYESVKARLIVEFYDCDADVGLDEADTLTPYHVNGENYYNFYLYYWEKKQGVWTKWSDLSPPFYYRIPRITTDNAKTALKGEIEINMEPRFFVPTSPFDTIKFEIMLVDRALNKSNTVFTPEIVKP